MRSGLGLEKCSKTAGFLLGGGRIFIGSVAKWLCCPLREATSAALPYTRRAGIWACTESTRPAQPRSTEPQPSQPQKELYPGRGFKQKRLAKRRHFATLPIHVAPSLCARLRIGASWAPLKGPLHIMMLQNLSNKDVTDPEGTVGNLVSKNTVFR